MSTTGSSMLPSFFKPRAIAIGVNFRGVISVLFAIYGNEAVSIISMRPASKKERETL